MKGNTLTEFIDDLLTMGGPEKEYEYRGNKYILECQPYEEDADQIEMVISECFGGENYIFRRHGNTLKDCVSQYEEAKIYDGRTIYEAEHEITILYG